MTQKQVDEIQARQSEARMYAGVEPLAFTRFEGGSTERYHAIGVYRVGGRLVARYRSDGFWSRVPETERALYLATMDQRDRSAAYVLRAFVGLPPVLESLVRQTVEQALEE